MESKKIPILHHITNTVASNLQAQVTELMGLIPIMGQSSLDAHEIAEVSSGLVLNLGMPNPDKLKAIKNTVPVYESSEKPIVLDPVGISMSNSRKEIALDILKNKKVSVVKGNTREIQALVEKYSKEDFSKAYNTVLVTTGKKIEIISSNKSKEFNMPKSKIHKLPGTGCIFGTLIGCLILRGYTPYIASIEAASMMEKLAEKIQPTLPYGKIQEVLLNELEVMSNESLLNHK